MNAFEKGISQDYEMFFYTPSEQAIHLFFYVSCVGHFVCNSEYEVNRNCYDSFLVIYVVSGKGFVEVDGKTQSLEAGAFALIDCYKAHRYYTNTSWEIYWVHFDGQLVRGYFENISSKDSILVMRDSFSAKRSIEKILTIFKERRKINEMAISNDITNILTKFSIANTDYAVKEKEETHFAVEEAVAYISCNIRKQLRLKEIADYVHVSPFYISRIFKKETGYSPYEYILYSKMNMARFYLKTTVLTIKEISIECGFSTESGFCTAFKKIEKMSPSTYRKKETEEELCV